MSGYIIGRLLIVVPTAVGITAVVFFALHLGPGDPALMVAGDEASAETVERVRRTLGLDRPLPEQYARYVWRLVNLDLGTSLRTSAPVLDAIADRLPHTMLLGVTALAIAVLVGVPLGLFTALSFRTRWDLAGLGIATVFVSAPTFWVGLLLIQWFAVELGWLPSAGVGTPANLVLPSLALAVAPLALLARLVRSEALEVLGEDYVRTARGKGLRERAVIARHVLKNTMLPVVTVIGLQLGSVFNGSVVTEAVFAWPGIGRLLVESILSRDFPVVQGTVLVVALGFALVNLVVDVLYGYLDPRIRQS